MKEFSSVKLAQLVSAGRQSMKLSQSALSQQTGINRATISRIEQGSYIPSIVQIQALRRG